MNYLKLNDFQCEVISFNKYTNFNENAMTGTCNCQVVTADITGLQNVGLNTITEIQIIHNEDVIYDLKSIQANIVSINENLVDDHIDILLSISFQ